MLGDNLPLRGNSLRSINTSKANKNHEVKRYKRISLPTISAVEKNVGAANSDKLGVLDKLKSNSRKIQFVATLVGGAAIGLAVGALFTTSIFAFPVAATVGLLIAGGALITASVVFGSVMSAARGYEGDFLKDVVLPQAAGLLAGFGTIFGALSAMAFVPAIWGAAGANILATITLPYLGFALGCAAPLMPLASGAYLGDMSFKEDIAEEGGLVDQLKRGLKNQQAQIIQEAQYVDQHKEKDSFIDLNFQREIDLMMDSYEIDCPKEVLKENINSMLKELDGKLQGQTLGVGPNTKEKYIESKAHQILEARFENLENAVNNFSSKDALGKAISGLSNYITKDTVDTRGKTIDLNFREGQLKFYLKALMLYVELSQNSD